MNINICTITIPVTAEGFLSVFSLRTEIMTVKVSCLDTFYRSLSSHSTLRSDRQWSVCEHLNRAALTQPLYSSVLMRGVCVCVCVCLTAAKGCLADWHTLMPEITRIHVRWLLPQGPQSRGVI